MSHPDIALKLFTNDENENQAAGGLDGDYQEHYDISMTIEEIIEFLGKIEDESSASNATTGRARTQSRFQTVGDEPLNLKQKYLE